MKRCDLFSTGWGAQEFPISRLTSSFMDLSHRTSIKLQEERRPCMCLLLAYHYFKSNTRPLPKRTEKLLDKNVPYMPATQNEESGSEK